MASQKTADVSPYLTGPVYAIGLLFVVMPIADTLAQVWPPALGNPAWRYGTIGVGANYLISVLLGMLLMCVVASLRWHRTALRSLAVLNLVIALLALLAVLFFVLDALQVRAGIPSANVQGLRMFDIGADKAVFKYLVSVLALVWMGVASWRAGKAIPHAKGGDEVPKLVMHQAGTT